MNTERKHVVQPEEKALKKGILIRGIGSFYTVRDAEQQEYTLRCKKKFRREKLSPMVGDDVMFLPGQGEEHGWIEEILQRKTVCLRPPVANVTKLVIVIAPIPEPDLLLVDRQISRAFSQGMAVLMVVNKCDLDCSLATKMKREYAQTGISVIEASAEPVWKRSVRHLGTTVSPVSPDKAEQEKAQCLMRCLT